jgi:hypothetical protein
MASLSPALSRRARGLLRPLPNPLPEGEGVIVPSPLSSPEGRGDLTYAANNATSRRSPLLMRSMA